LSTHVRHSFTVRTVRGILVGELLGQVLGRHLGTFMIRPSAALVLCGAVMSIAALGGCTSSAPPEGEPTFYQNLAQPDVTVDAAAAASMISGYRSNNGLGAVTVDAELMRMA